MELIYYPNPKLRQPSVEVSPGPETTALAQAMLTLLLEEGSAGLAAPQVGRNIRLFVGSDGTTVLNPRIVESRGKQTSVEGCLSLPGISGKVTRAKWIAIEGLDLEGNAVRIEAEDFAACVAQHEIDHLDGVLMIDRFGPARKHAIKRILRRLETDYDG